MAKENKPTIKLELNKGFIPEYFVPTPSVLVNRYMKEGGLASGSVVQVNSSGEGTFKSTFSFQTAANAQRMGMRVGIIDAEGALKSYYDDNDRLRNHWLEALGLDPAECYIQDADTGEMLWEVAFSMIRDYGVQFLVFDSIAMAQVTKIHESEMGDHSIGLHAKMNTIALTKLIPIVRKHQAIFIGINHKKVNLTNQGAMGEKAVGGKGWGFAPQYIFQMKRTTSRSALEDKDIIPIEIYIEKNKSGKQFVAVNTFAEQGVGIKEDIELAIIAEELGLIKKAGSWWKDSDGNTIGQGDSARFEWALLNKQLILEHL